VLAKKGEISEVERQIGARQRDIENISSDQARVRENMKALRGSAEERSLVQRYTRQLNEQEDRIAALRTELAQLTAHRDELQRDLNAAIERLDIDQQL
jgi:flagellar biosynthesis chaperone FliJ